MSSRLPKTHRSGRALLAGAVLLLGSSLSVHALPHSLHPKPLILRTVGTDVVTSAADNGAPGTLRSVLAAAASGDTVTFDPAVFAVPRKITLHGTELDISQDVTIQGPGASLLTLDAGQASYVFNITGGTVEISGLTAANGEGANDDGNIVNSGILALADVAVTSSIGSGVDNEDVLTATDCTFSGVTTSQGGALYNNGSATLTNCTFAGNSTAAGGGGLYNVAIITLANCTFFGNTAPYGGAVYDAGTLSATSCTFSGNDATQSGSGGGLCEDGTATVTACLFAGSGGGDIDLNFGVLTSGGSNLLGDAAASGDFTTAGTNDQFGVSAAQAAVKTLANNGGPTQTCALGAGSFAIDADYSSGFTLDQRGVLRPQGIRNDIGAYEAGTLSSISVTPAAPASVNTGATQQFTATATYSDGTTADVTSIAAWASDSTTHATVSPAGLATGVAAGTAHISAALGSRTASVLLTVTVAAPAPVAFVLWNSVDGQVQVRAVNYTGSQTTLATFGPYSDSSDQGVPGNTALWKAVAVARTPDGTLRLLWQHPDGRVMLWRLSASGTPLSITGYGPYTDTGDTGVPGNTGLWQAVGLSVSAEGLTHLLWDHPDGRAMLWNVNSDDTFSVIGGYGPYTDSGDAGIPGNAAVWQVTTLASAADGSFRLVWNHPDGRVMLWSVSGTGALVSLGGYGPYTDSGSIGVAGNTALWRAAAVQVGADGNARLLWDHPDGRSMLWDVDSSLNPAVIAGYGPYTDPPVSAGLWRGIGLALTPSGLPYVLWGNPDGRTVLWNIAGDGTVGYSGIFEVASDSAGQPWLPTALSGD